MAESPLVAKACPVLSASFSTGVGRCQDTAFEETRRKNSAWGFCVIISL